MASSAAASKTVWAVHGFNVDDLPMFVFSTKAKARAWAKKQLAAGLIQGESGPDELDGWFAYPMKLDDGSWMNGQNKYYPDNSIDVVRLVNGE